MRHHRFTNIRGTAKVQDSSSGGRYRSKLERDGWLRWMLDPDVALACLQMPRIKNPDVHGSWKRYTGDMLVDFKLTQRRQLVVEFKYEDELKTLREKGDNRYVEVAGYLETRKRDFLIQTEKHVYAAGFPMMRFVWDYRNNSAHTAGTEILDYVISHPGVALGAMIGALRTDRLIQMQLVSEVWRLVAKRQLRVDFTKVLNLSAKLEIGSV